MALRLQAAVARTVITPPLSIAHAGWGAQTHQRAEGVDLDLLATVLVVADGESEAALVDVEFCTVGRELSDRIRNAVSDLTGIPVVHVRLSYTHTHSGPMLGSSWMSEGEELIPAYAASLPGRIAGAAWEARRQLRPARAPTNCRPRSGSPGVPGCGPRRRGSTLAARKWWLNCTACGSDRSRWWALPGSHSARSGPA